MAHTAAQSSESPPHLRGALRGILQTAPRLLGDAAIGWRGASPDTTATS